MPDVPVDERAGDRLDIHIDLELATCNQLIKVFTMFCTMSRRRMAMDADKKVGALATFRGLLVAYLVCRKNPTWGIRGSHMCCFVACICPLSCPQSWRFVAGATLEFSGINEHSEEACKVRHTRL
jgi:hypothetical protein